MDSRTYSPIMNNKRSQERKMGGISEGPSTQIELITGSTEEMK